MRTATYFDDNGVERHTLTNRKVRKDRGTVRPHPLSCQHCVMVKEYRSYRDAETALQAQTCGDGWHDSGAIRHRYTFKTWLVMYYGNQRRIREYEEEEAARWATADSVSLSSRTSRESEGMETLPVSVVISIQPSPVSESLSS